MRKCVAQAGHELIIPAPLPLQRLPEYTNQLFLYLWGRVSLYSPGWPGLSFATASLTSGCPACTALGSTLEMLFFWTKVWEGWPGKTVLSFCLTYEHRLGRAFLLESMIYTPLGFATQRGILVRGKRLKPRERISLPVRLVIYLLKSSRQTQSPVWDHCGFLRRVRTVPQASSLLSGLSSILPQRPRKALFTAAFCWFYSQLLTPWDIKTLMIYK